MFGCQLFATSLRRLYLSYRAFKLGLSLLPVSAPFMTHAYFQFKIREVGVFALVLGMQIRPELQLFGVAFVLAIGILNTLAFALWNSSLHAKSKAVDSRITTMIRIYVLCVLNLLGGVMIYGTRFALNAN